MNLLVDHCWARKGCEQSSRMMGLAPRRSARGGSSHHGTPSTVSQVARALAQPAVQVLQAQQVQLEQQQQRRRAERARRRRGRALGPGIRRMRR